MKAVLDQLKGKGHHVDDVDLAHLSPARYAHINHPMGSIASTEKWSSIAKVFAH
jgi:hypothetical protein